MMGKVGRAPLPASAAPFSSRRSGGSKPTGNGWAWTVTYLYVLYSREILATLNHDQPRAPGRNACDRLQRHRRQQGRPLHAPLGEHARGKRTVVRNGERHDWGVTLVEIDPTRWTLLDTVS